MTHDWRVTDLSALADRLRKTKRHKKLVGLIARAAAAGTIREDLLEAERCLEEIERIQAGRNQSEAEVDAREVTITGALFSHAVVLYGRATFTSSEERRGLPGEDHLTVPLRAAHRAIKKLRNSGIAHYGRAEHLPDGPLVREAVVYTFWRTDGHVRDQVNVLSTRAQHKVSVQRQLKGLVRAQLDHLALSQQDYLTAVREELETAVKADSDLGRMLPTLPFDPYAFCASPEAALKLAVNLQRGELGNHSYAVGIPDAVADGSGSPA